MKYVLLLVNSFQINPTFLMTEQWTQFDLKLKHFPISLCIIILKIYTISFHLLRSFAARDETKGKTLLVSRLVFIVCLLISDWSTGHSGLLYSTVSIRSKAFWSLKRVLFQNKSFGRYHYNWETNSWLQITWRLKNESMI